MAGFGGQTDSGAHYELGSSRLPHVDLVILLSVVASLGAKVLESQLKSSIDTAYGPIVLREELALAGSVLSGHGDRGGRAMLTCARDRIKCDSPAIGRLDDGARIGSTVQS